MLVFAEDYIDEYGKKSGLQHILERYVERGGPDPEILLTSVAEINRHLPDDWRMTRATNNFRVQIIAEGSSPYLVGYSRRAPDGEILHIVHTVLAKDHFDSHDAEKEGISPTKRIDRGDRRRHPKIVVPNLYYFRPCPEFSKTPLFARQFEKVPESPGDDQFHRIHGLTKTGLDPDHYLWIRWTIDGDVEFVDHPDPNYHGQNYWLIPWMKKVDVQRCKENYERKLHEYNINPTPPPSIPAAIPRYESEFKFFIKDVDEEITVRPVLEFIEKRGFSVQADTSKEHRDIYLDDSKRHLYASGASFRLRTQQDNVRVTLKKRFPAEDGAKDLVYRRIEEEVVISPSERDALLKGRPIATLPYRLLAYVVPPFDPTRDRLRRVLSVCTLRRTILLMRGFVVLSCALTARRTLQRMGKPGDLTARLSWRAKACPAKSSDSWLTTLQNLSV